MVDLQGQELKAWECIVQFWAEHEKAPTLQSVGQCMGYAPKFARQYAKYHTEKLEEKGYITLDHNGYRKIRIKGDNRQDDTSPRPDGGVE